MKKKKIILCLGIGAVVLLASGSVLAYQATENDKTETVYKEVTVEKGNLTVGVTESGSVTIGTLEQELEIESTSSGTSGSTQSGGNQGTAASNTSSGSSAKALEVEEVYVSVGQQVAARDPILKLTAESVEAYRDALEDAVTEASVSVSEASLAAEQQKLEASYAYNLSVAEGSVAEANYQATLEELAENLEKAQEAFDESAALVNYYQEQIDAGVDLSESLASEQENYNKLYNRLLAAQSSYTTKSIEAEAAYEKALLSSENAGSQYNVDVSGADNEISTAQDTLADAKEALEEFDACVGEDGILYAEYTGTVMAVSYEAGDTISSDTSIVTFANDEEVTMSVSVSEEDIANIAVGDVVNIELTAYEDVLYAGEVLGVDTSTSSGSSTVSYEVTVAFTGDITGIYTDMTGNVTFIEKQVEDVLYVSNKAIISEGTVSYVKVKDADGTIRKVQVETGFSDGVNVEIASGVSEGETVLIESQVKADEA